MLLTRIGRTAAVLGLVIATAGPAAAGMVVVQNSSYQIQVKDSGDGRATGTFKADGTAQQFTYHGVPITVTESETYLGGNQYVVTIDLAADYDIFPTTGLNHFAYVNIGASRRPLQLTGPFDLTRALLTYTNGTGRVLAKYDLIHNVQHPDPWDGFLPGRLILFGVSPLTGRDVQDVKFELNLTAVPEPTTLVPASLVALAGLGYGWLRRRRPANA